MKGAVRWHEGKEVEVESYAAGVRGSGGPLCVMARVAEGEKAGNERFLGRIRRWARGMVGKKGSVCQVSVIRRQEKYQPPMGISSHTSKNEGMARSAWTRAMPEVVQTEDANRERVANCEEIERSAGDWEV